MLKKAGIEFAQLEFMPGMLDVSIFHTAPPEASGKTLVKYGEGINIGRALLFSANAVYGLGLHGQPLLHCHGSFLDAESGLCGGHVNVQECRVGRGGLSAQVTATPNIGFAVDLDLTSNMQVFHPVSYPGGRHGS
ncbi:hypothetical protein [Pollutimonas bauzanensis]|uniref:PPC domain-containing protein n=1 Tax=Pollutimonas bauzanensis TaxID=658167 RepID=A0A1M5X589_9BURK|nr:hypothetical protein [Pollutimonas bauzanensis]SHH94373.1 hypothetical protein SAMN04488135_106125 [Pollutimonas bauzanensis]